MKYFFDHNISPKYAQMLCALDVEAIALRDEFAVNISDVDLLSALSQRDLVFVTGDRKIRNVSFEVEMLKAANITSLFLAPFWSKKKFWQQATWLIRHWPTIENFATSVAKGTCAEFKQNGKAQVFTL